jgi:uncharacterized RDD family membrane protein YckC
LPCFGWSASGCWGPLLWFLFGLIPLAYHTLLRPAIGDLGNAMLRCRTALGTGERPGFLQALAQTALFYITVGATCSLILLFVLFNRRRRTLHDVLAGTVIVRTFPV